MNIFARIKSWAAGTMHKVGQALSFIPEWIRVSWFDTNFLSLVQNGYKASSAVANCVRALAFSFPEPQLVAYKQTPEGEEPAGANDPLQRLIRRPNPDMGEAEFMQFVITYASCGGNIYTWMERTRNGKVLYLWPFSDKDMTPVPGKNSLEGFVAGYKFDCGDGDPIYIPKSDVIHWKWMVDPEQPWRGVGAIEFALRDVQSDTESSRYTYAMFKNNAVPPFVMTMPEGEDFTTAKAKRIKAQWKQHYGAEGQENIGLVPFGVSIQKLGLNMQELALTELKNVPESRICGAFGVPPTIAMLYVGLKRSDYGDMAARKSFTETTLVALWRTFASEMTASLSDEFGGGYTLHFDLNQVKALQENVNELWTRLSTATDRGLITRADFKRGVGLKALPTDNVYRTSLISGWVPADEKPEPLIPAPVNKALNPGSIVSTETVIDRKNRSAMAVYGQTLQRIRRSMQPAMSKDLDGYFKKLADRVVSRAGKSLQLLAEKKGDLPNLDDLITPKDVNELEKVIKRWFISIGQASWETINLSLGIMADFDLTDPSITAMLSKSAMDVTEITQTTREALREALQYGNENGWSIQQLVKGDENQAGIQSIVTETYQHRSESIARTELGNAQNAVTAERYKANGVTLVGILDNGDDDDDDECKVANGQTWTLAFFEQNKLEHPNCTRCSYPIFEDVQPDQG